MANREVPMSDSQMAVVQRLVAAVEALLANLADADQHIDVDGELLPDVKELVDAVAAVKLRVGRQ